MDKPSKPAADPPGTPAPLDSKRPGPSAEAIRVNAEAMDKFRESMKARGETNPESPPFKRIGQELKPGWMDTYVENLNKAQRDKD